jgi:CubicO group peptidase (beta-lactamase class C family)
LRKTVAGVAATLLCLAGTTGGSPQKPEQLPSPAIEPVACPAPWDESLLATLVKPHEPGLAVYVYCAPQSAVFRSYGLRDLRRSKASIDSATNFRLASVTKQFTAMTIMLLVRDGKLRYDQTLASLWPDFPAYGKNITIRQLLQHTSGLPDYEDLMEAIEKSHGPRWSPEKQIQDTEVLALLKAETHGKFPPGSSWAYSNSGYVVLGLIIAKVSGVSYPDFLRARIFAPLHMDNTIVYVRGKNEVANRAYGHSQVSGSVLANPESTRVSGSVLADPESTKDSDTFRETDQSSTSATLGDGGIYSNLLDLAKWDDALRNHTLLGADEMQPALTPATLAGGSQPHWPSQPADENLHPGEPVFYGFGWFLDPYKVLGAPNQLRPRPRMWHYGSTVGFRTAIERLTEQPLTVIVLCNRTDLDPQELAHRIADSYLRLK